VSCSENGASVLAGSPDGSFRNVAEESVPHIIRWL
jgi:hypothetical protein